jgi:uncharacterized DUF497 family protein
MESEWDPKKAKSNWQKHGIRFADALLVLEDPAALTMRDEAIDDEERWITMGLDALGRVLVVVYTWRGKRLRLISARTATAGESRVYREGA